MVRRARDRYDLWDYESGNLLGAYDSEDAALAIVQATIGQYGDEAVRGWGLGHDRRGKLVSLIEGDALVHRASCASPTARSHGGAAD